MCDQSIYLQYYRDYIPCSENCVTCRIIAEIHRNMYTSASLGWCAMTYTSRQRDKRYQFIEALLEVYRHQRTVYDTSFVTGVDIPELVQEMAEVYNIYYSNNFWHPVYSGDDVQEMWSKILEEWSIIGSEWEHLFRSYSPKPVDRQDRLAGPSC